MKTIAVPQKVYEQMEEIKGEQNFISNVFDLVSTIYCHDLHEWLYSPDQVNAEQSRWREKQFIKYFYGELDVKPEDKRYLVYHSSGIDLYEENVFSGLTYESGVTHMDWDYVISYFKPLTKEQITQFQNDSGLVIPEDWLHEVNED